MSPLMALDLTRVDLSHQYDPDAPVKMKYRVMQTNGVITVYLFVKMDSLSLWERDYFLQRSYNSESHQVISPELKAVMSNSSIWQGSISFTAPKDEDLLVLKFASDYHFYFDIPLNAGRHTFPSFVPITKGEPILTPYVPTANLQWSHSSTMLAGSYTDNFASADPPMEEMKPLAPVMAEDTLFVVLDSSFLVDYHFYFFREDSAADKGITLLKTPPYFPTFRLIEELIPPMKYITTEAEFRALSQTNKPKRTFDEFWINTYGTKFRARNSIRRYYRSVELANEYFTSFKQGWKTDQGMIFIVYGTPMEMYRSENGEKWIYENIEFEFVKVSTLFGSLYALRKDRKYEKDWYRAVGRLRKGE